MDMEPDVETNLRGQHLSVVPYQTYPAMDIKRNESGSIIEMTGFTVEVFNYVVRSMDFSYTLFQEYVPNYDDEVVNGTLYMGSVRLCNEKYTDVVIGGMAMSAEYYNVVDFVRLETTVFGCMIPLPKSTIYLGATWLPFSFFVWIILLCNVIFLLGLIYGFSRIESKCITTESTTTSRISDFYNAIGYTFQPLISQGTSFSSKMLGFRVLVGTWALGSFLLVNYYNSILTSFFTAPNYQLLIQSPFDLPKKPDIKVVVDAISAPVFLVRDAEQGLDKYLKEMWKNDPKLLCERNSECLDQVLKGSSVYTEVNQHVMDVIGRDMMEHGKCRFTIAKETYHNFHGGYQLAKGSKFTEMFNKEVLKAESFGLINYWKRTKEATNAMRCMNENGAPDDGTPLTLINLSSAFIILPIGWLLSLIVFLIEKFNSKIKMMKSRQEQQNVITASFWF